MVPTRWPLPRARRAWNEFRQTGVLSRHLFEDEGSAHADSYLDCDRRLHVGDRRRRHSSASGRRVPRGDRAAAGAPGATASGDLLIESIMAPTSDLAEPGPMVRSLAGLADAEA